MASRLSQKLFTAVPRIGITTETVRFTHIPWLSIEQILLV